MEEDPQKDIIKGDKKDEKKTKLKLQDNPDKVVDVRRTCLFVSENSIVSQYCLGEFQYNPDILGPDHSLVRLNSFAYISRTCIFQILIIGLAQTGGVCAIGLLLVEFSYLFFTMRNYVKYKFLKNRLLLVNKLLESLFLVVILSLMLTFCKNNPYKTANVDPQKQKIVIYLIFTAVILQFLLALVILGYHIYSLLKLKKLKKNSQNETSLNIDSLVIKYRLKPAESSTDNHPQKDILIKNNKESDKITIKNQTENDNIPIKAKRIKMKKKRRKRKRVKKSEKMFKAKPKEYTPSTFLSIKELLELEAKISTTKKSTQGKEASLKFSNVKNKPSKGSIPGNNTGV